MREPATFRRHLTFEEFLAVEAVSEERHEFVGGLLHAMAGASQPHNHVQSNIVIALGIAAEDTTCIVYGSDMLVKAAEDAAYYPDVSVDCGPVVPGRPFIDQPCLVVEITSPGSVSADRRDKLMNYRRIESLQAYLIVYQNERRIIRHFRDAKGAWWEEDITGDGAIRLQCPDTQMPRSLFPRRVL